MAQKFDIKEAMEAMGDIKPPVRPYIHVGTPDASDFRLRSNMLRDIAENIIEVASSDAKDIPEQLLTRYNELVTLCYEISDLEYDLYKTYR